MHGVREGEHPENVQKQVFIPEARVPLPRGAAEEGVPLSCVLQGVLEAGQNEKSHEDDARLLRPQRLCLHAKRVFYVTGDGGAAVDRPED